MPTARFDATALLPDLIGLRRGIHADPEIGLDLPRTQRRILDALAPLQLPTTLGTATTSVTAVIRGGRPGPAVLLRADMDALPIVEQTGLDYAATNGAMHACGHDLHVAGLVGAARLLAERREDLPGSVVLMFQPGEEGSGGAALMIEEGVLDAAGDRVVAAYGIHVFPGELGVFHTRPGAMLASVADLHITVHGRGGHGSLPESALDPVPALLEIGTALQTLATRRFGVTDPVVLSVTQLAAGEAINVIPASASLGATVRTLSREATAKLDVEVHRLAAGIARAHGLEAVVEFRNGYPVTVNDPAETAVTVAELADAFGESRVAIMPKPLMGGEDFSFVLEQVPGTFVGLACSPAELPEASVGAWNHSPTVLFDDAVLGVQAEALAELAWRRLERGR